MGKNGQQLRFAALIRVSTEKQEKQGESLNTQKTQLQDDVERLHGKIVEWYGGQEHATPGHETNEVDRLVDAARTNIFDAVIVAHQDRWSRDNARSKAGIKVFRQHKIRFFVRTFEYVLNNPTHRFELAMSAEIAELHASTQNQKSLENRIERAKRGYVTSGNKPFGRLVKKGELAANAQLDPEKHAMVKDVAKRYIAGESMAKLAEEYSVNHSSLHKTLTTRCGNTWEQTFNSDELNIHETVIMTVPRLLPEKTIKAILKRVAANKTYSRGQRKNNYLLAHLIFCNHCGYTMFGQTNHPNSKLAKKRYYRHAREQGRDRPCPCKVKTWIDAQLIEENVLRVLFDVFSNPKRIQQAIDEATPNRDKIASLREDQKHWEELLKQTKLGKERVVKKVADGVLSDAEITKQMGALREREAEQREKLQRIKNQLEGVPSPEEVQAVSKVLSGRIYALRDSATDYNAMTWDEKRALVEQVFGVEMPDGKRGGVYIEWMPGDDKRSNWKFSIRGTINQDKLAPLDYETLSERYDEPEKQQRKRGVTQYACHSPGTAPRERCSAGRTRPPAT